MANSMHSARLPRRPSGTLAPHIVSLIRERRRRVNAAARYDRYIEQARGRLYLQDFWLNLKRQDEDEAQRLQNRIDREIADCQ